MTIKSESDTKTLNAIGFGLGSKNEFISNKKYFDTVYSIDENHWNGNTSLQLILKDIKKGEK